MIKANAHKYSVSAMCRVLQVNRSTYYYEAKQKKDETELISDITEIFKSSRNHYGTRKNQKRTIRKRKTGVPPQNWTDHETGRISINLYNCTI